MLEKEIINKITGLIKHIFKDNDDLSVIPYYEFLEDRTQVMVIVGIENTTQVNHGLDDYQYDLTITVDSLIADDPTGDKFISVYSEIESVLRDYIIKVKPLKDLFEEIPAVGFLYTGNTFSISNDSNRSSMAFQLFTSAEMI